MVLSVNLIMMLGVSTASEYSREIISEKGVQEGVE